jgi:hypothetical protein
MVRSGEKTSLVQLSSDFFAPEVKERVSQGTETCKIVRPW